MSCTPLWTVWCDGDGCLQWCAHGNTVAIAREEAKRYGWVRRRQPDGTTRDLCPSCAVTPVVATAEVDWPPNQITP